MGGIETVEIVDPYTPTATVTGTTITSGEAPIDNTALNTLGFVETLEAVTVQISFATTVYSGMSPSYVTTLGLGLGSTETFEVVLPTPNCAAGGIFTAYYANTGFIEDQVYSVVGANPAASVVAPESATVAGSLPSSSSCAAIQACAGTATSATDKSFNVYYLTDTTTSANSGWKCVIFKLTGEDPSQFNVPPPAATQSFPFSYGHSQ